MSMKYTGLTAQEVESRVKDGQVNTVTSSISRTKKEIFKAHIFTFFNFLNIFLAALVLFTGQIKNLTFLFTIVANSFIGIVQELKVKSLVDKLSVITASKAKVIRDGEQQEIALDELVVDDIMILEGSKVNVTIASIGWSTMATPAGLDFSNATPAGLTAYIASSVSGSGVTLTSVDEAAGAEGVMLKGTAGATYSIPIKAAATTTGTNKLSAAYSATPADADKIYILKDGKFCLVNTGGTKVPAGKAYLLASEVPSGAHDLTINFGSNGDITGISDMKTMRNVENEKFYNLAGQLVAQPAKGLYITNGRKVVLK